MATTGAAGSGRPPVSSIRTSRPYLPGSRGAGTTIVIVCASVLTRRAATLVDRVGAGTLGAAVAGVAEPVRSATTSRTPGPEGGGGSRVRATPSESRARVLQVAAKPIAAGMAPPVHVRRTGVWLWPSSGPSTAGAANLIDRRARE